MQARGQELLAGNFQRAVVILGRPYNTLDPFLNLNLSIHLKRLGILAIPMGYLPLHKVRLDER